MSRADVARGVMSPQQASLCPMQHLGTWARGTAILALCPIPPSPPNTQHTSWAPVFFTFNIRLLNDDHSFDSSARSATRPQPWASGVY
jgi:hypothetical protein